MLNATPATEPAATPITTQPTTPVVREQPRTTTAPVTRPRTTRTVEPEVEEKPEPEWEMDDKNPFELVDYGSKRPNSDEPIESPRDTSIHYDNPFELVSNGRIALYVMPDKKISTTTRKVVKKKSRKKKVPTIFDDKKLNYKMFVDGLKGYYSMKAKGKLTKSRYLTLISKDNPVILQSDGCVSIYTVSQVLSSSSYISHSNPI